MKTVPDSELIGVDEAGLGPVFGPLVIAGARVKAKHVARLKEIGVRDSKMFGGGDQSRSRRRRVWREAEPLIEDFDFRVISARQIDNHKSRGLTMYDLEIGATASILNRLGWRTAKRIYLHQLGMTTKERYLERLQGPGSEFADGFAGRVVYGKDLDSKYIPVSMASIIAKVTRDTIVEKACRRLGEAYVSGYPTPVTATFFQRYHRRHHDLPDETRRTRNWPPLLDLLSFR